MKVSYVIIVMIPLLLLSALPVHAGTITFTIENTTGVTGQQVDSEFRIINKGSDAAWNISLQAEFLAQKHTVAIGQRLAPGTAKRVNLVFELPPNAKGDFPIYATITYDDASGKRSSIAVLAIVHTVDALAPELSMQLIQGRTPREPSLLVNLATLKTLPLQVTLTCYIPNDLAVDSSTQQVIIHNGAASTEFHIQNRSGSSGSRYGVFVTAEYDVDDIHFLVSQSVALPVEMLPPAKQDSTLQFKPIGTLSIAGGLLIIAGGILIIFSRVKARKEIRWAQLVLDILVLVIIELFIFSKITPQYLLTATITTGGDTASHYYTAEYLRHVLLPQGKISGWMPGNYAGFPILQMYFPLPFLLMCALNIFFIPLQIAFKWVTLLGTFLLPIAMYSMLRSLRSQFPGPAIGAAFTLPFLFNQANSMWGGNIPSTLAGEFTYSLSLALTFIFLGSLYRGCTENRHILRNALLVFLIGFSHGYTLLFAEAVSLFFLITPQGFMKRLIYLLKVYVLGFFFLAFWLIPLLVFGKYTTPSHMAWMIYSIKEIFPEILLPIVFLALGSSIALIIRHIIVSERIELRSMLSVVGFLWFGVLVAALMFVLAPKLGVVDIRYVPCGQLMLCALAALGLGWLGAWLTRWRISWIYLFLIVGATLFWTNTRVGYVPDWTKWNYEGFEAKPAWPLFYEINERLRGSFQDPRVVFEHSPQNNEFGSSRVFESLPLFSGRATLEGLYMEASLSAPFVMYIQSEISQHPSCPFKNYYCSAIDFSRARRHLELFNVRELILRSRFAKSAIRNEPDYQLKHTVGDVELWELTSQPSRYVVPLRYEPVIYAGEQWKTAVYQWFLRNELNDVHLVAAAKSSREQASHFTTVVDTVKPLPKIPIDTSTCQIRETMHNDEILIETNWLNKPLLVKVSHHPNWQVEGADRIYQVSPSFMLIYPRQKHVRLYYRSGLPEWSGHILTGLGVIILLLNIPLPRKERQTPWMLLARRIGIPVSLEFQLPWNLSLATRRFMLAGIMFIVSLGIGWGCYQAYTNDPQRWFNAAVLLKDAKRFEEAREAFQKVLKEVSPVSRLSLDSAYFISISYALEQNHPKAIETLQTFIDSYPYNGRIPEAAYHLGNSYFSLNQEQQGIERMKFVIEQYPNTIWTDYAKERLEEHGIFLDVSPEQQE